MKTDRESESRRQRSLISLGRISARNRAAWAGLLALAIACATMSCKSRAARAPCPSIEVSVAADGQDEANRSVALPDGSHVLLTAEPLVTSADMTGAHASLTEGQYVLNIDVTPERAQYVRTFSERNVGRTLVFLVDGRVVRTPRIRDPITGNGFLIGPLERGEAERLADGVNTGCRR